MSTATFQYLRYASAYFVFIIQALAVADAVTFRNCLVTMRPQTTKSELPSRDAVRRKIENCFVDYLDQLRADISAAPGNVSALWDLWTAKHTSTPYLGLLLQWIQVDGDKWVFRNEVGAFREIFGKHSGINLGRYLILLLDRVGVTSKTHSKVRHLSLHVTSVTISDFLTQDGAFEQ